MTDAPRTIRLSTKACRLDTDPESHVQVDRLEARCQCGRIPMGQPQPPLSRLRVRWGPQQDVAVGDRVMMELGNGARVAGTVTVADPGSFTVEANPLDPALFPDERNP